MIIPLSHYCPALIHIIPWSYPAISRWANLWPASLLRLAGCAIGIGGVFLFPGTKKWVPYGIAMHWFSWEHWTRNPPCFRKKTMVSRDFCKKTNPLNPPSCMKLDGSILRLNWKQGWSWHLGYPQKLDAVMQEKEIFPFLERCLGLFFASYVHLSEFLAGLRYSVIDDILKKKWAPDCMAQIQLIAEQFAGDRLQHWYNMASVVNFLRKKNMGKADHPRRRWWPWRLDLLMCCLKCQTWRCYWWRLFTAKRHRLVAVGQRSMQGQQVWSNSQWTSGKRMKKS